MEHAGHVVTPQGLRAGEPGALAALCERRGAAVLAYTREVCDPTEAPLAAAEALARFRAAVWAAGDATDLDPERLLLSATRHAAAERARTPPEASATRRILGRAQTLTCARMPALIVARTENLLGSADLDRLSRHLERCQACRAAEAAFRRAERAYIATTHAPLDASTTALLLAALAEAAPVEAQAPPLPEQEAFELESAEPDATEPVEPQAAGPQPVEPQAAGPEPAEPAPAEPAPAEPETALEPTADLLPAEPLYPAPALPPTEALPAEQLPDELDDADEDGWAEDHRDPHMLEPGPATWNATEEAPRRRRLRIVLPVIVLAAGAAAALAIAGVFDSGGSGGGSPATTRARPATTTHTTTAKRTHHKRATHTTTVTATP